MDNEILKILNEELIELKQHTKLAEQRLDLQREELNRHSEMFQKQTAILDRHSDMLGRHQAGFDILFRNMKNMEERMSLELKKLRDSNK